MKYRYIITLGFASLLTLGSCGEDFLYKSPQGSIDEVQLTTPDGVELLVINAYANLTENDWGASPLNWAMVACMVVMPIRDQTPAISPF